MATRSDFQAALGQLDAEIVEAERHLEGLRLQRLGAEAFLARLPDSGRTSPDRVSRRSSGGNAEIVAGILAEVPEGLDLRAIEAAAEAAGHTLNNEQIRSAVTYLRRRGDAERVGRGVWRLLTPTNAESPEAPGLSVLPPPQPAEVETG